MDIRNCPNCGKLFAYVNRNLCPECLQKDEADFDRVRDYIYDNPKAALEQIAEATDIPTKKILTYLKDGRLMLKDTTSALLQCEMCSEPILTGRLCDKCSQRLRRGLGPTPKRGDHRKSPLTGTSKARVHLSKLSKDEKR